MIVTYGLLSFGIGSLIGGWIGYHLALRPASKPKTLRDYAREVCGQDWLDAFDVVNDFQRRVNAELLVQ